MNKGFIGTIATSAVVIAAVYVGLKYSQGVFDISGGKNGLAANFGKFSRVAQGA